MNRRIWPLFVLLLAAGCGDDPSGPDGPMLLTVTTESWDYLDNRFFRLDLPGVEAPGRAAGERIDLDSIRIFRFVGGGAPQPSDLQNVAVTVDSTGRWTGLPPAGDSWTTGLVWRLVAFAPYLAETGDLIAVDLQQEMATTDLLGVVYNVVDAGGHLVYHVGENPELTSPGLEIDGEFFYRMKLIKPSTRDPFTFQYVLRNVYWLGAEDIQPCDFDLVIERNTDEANPGVEYNGLSYLRIFGLDRHGPDGNGLPDGLVDENDIQLFDLARGLLRFPLDFPRPFAANAEAYAANAGVALEDFHWEDTFLSQYLTPEIYDPDTLPSQYPNYGTFRLIATVGPG